MTVSPPRVLAVKEDGVEKEPLEEVIVDVDVQYQGLIIESMSKFVPSLLCCCRLFARADGSLNLQEKWRYVRVERVWCRSSTHDIRSAESLVVGFPK